MIKLNIDKNIEYTLVGAGCSHTQGCAFTVFKDNEIEWATKAIKDKYNTPCTSDFVTNNLTWMAKLSEYLPIDKIVNLGLGGYGTTTSVRYIKDYLKNKSDEVIIGIDSDKRVKELKGPHRPINNERDRKLMLESLSFVDSVLIFDSADELELLVKTISPDLMVVGSDYRDRHVVGGEYAKKLEFFEKIDGYSTTRTLQRSTDR